MNKSLTTNGTCTSIQSKYVEVSVISRNGIVMTINGNEYYLSYDKFPWFKHAAVDDVFNVRMTGRSRIRWDALDVDLSMSIISNPDKYPLVAE